MIEIAEVVKGISWIDHVINMDEESIKNFPIVKANYIRNIISSTVALKYPKRNYSTETTEELLIVNREKDTIDEKETV